MATKMIISAALALALAPIAKAIASDSGSLFNRSRDAFCLAFEELKQGKDAATAVKQAIVKAGGNDGSVRSYLSTLTWCADHPNIVPADKLATLTSIEADKARYPDKYAAKPDMKTTAGRKAKAEADAVKALEKQEKADKEHVAWLDTQTPRNLQLARIAAACGKMDESQLAAVEAALNDIADVDAQLADMEQAAEAQAA